MTSHNRSKAVSEDECLQCGGKNSNHNLAIHKVIIRDLGQRIEKAIAKAKAKGK